MCHLRGHGEAQCWLLAPPAGFVASALRLPSQPENAANACCVGLTHGNLHPCNHPTPPADGTEGSESSGDPRAALVLQLLLSSLEQPAPNLAHLLCGFDFDAGERPVG